MALGRPPRPSMPLLLHMAQGNARRVAGKKGSAKLPAQAQCVAAWAYYPNTEGSDQYMKTRRETHHHPPALDKQPLTESPTMRSFVAKRITTPVVFKTIPYSRRAQLWNRQASIIMDLTTLALRHGWRCLPRVWAPKKFSKRWGGTRKSHARVIIRRQQNWVSTERRWPRQRRMGWWAGTPS